MDDIFMGYAKHEQEKEMVIQMLMNQIANGGDVDSIVLQIQLDDDFSEGDWEYIENEICRRVNGE